MAESKPRQGFPGERRCGQHGTRRRCLFSEPHRHPHPTRALSRLCSCHAGSGVRPDRHDDRCPGRNPAAAARRHNQSLCRAGEEPLGSGADIPTADEAGLPGFYVSNWFGLWAPRGTPKEIIGKLNAAAVSSLADPAVRQKLADLGFEIPPRDQQTPEALGAFQKSRDRKVVADHQGGEHQGRLSGDRSQPYQGNQAMNVDAWPMSWVTQTLKLNAFSSRLASSSPLPED